ncbi:MAG TPA: DegT/DnrJ/EryC1/StrS family aminotransferase [Chloroflexota bacterium]|jgi:dTDP-4-amino-4,6-dideoxygalactose transaminase|nr:DegT/DnrJ/EryC1/StrS family aminotransferase [Chloroflexota bacterium]
MTTTAPERTAPLPLVDLHAQYAAIQAEIQAAIAEVLDRMQLILGPHVQAFEAEFAAYCEAAHAVGVGSGTEALVLALRAAGIGPGDEVITVSHTFFADCEAIVQVGAQPVFVDVRPDTQTMDPASFAAAITARTRAVIPVHLYGQPADMDEIAAIARRHGLFVLEDACQAHGARYRGRRVGTLGHAAAFSFYPGKNLGAYGDGGAVVTNDATLAERIRRLRDHGTVRKYEHYDIGSTGRLDELQAAVLRVKLRYLDTWNARRAAAAATYTAGLTGTEVTPPAVRDDRTHVFHLYAVQAPRRDALRAYLAEQGIATGMHYPIPCHLQPAAREWSAGPGSLPVTERLAAHTLSLPLFPEITDAQLARVIAAVRAFSEGTG